MNYFKRIKQAVLVSAVVALTSTAAFAETTVVVGYQQIVGPFLTAIADGKFDAAAKEAGYKIDWRQFASGGDISTALASGNDRMMIMSDTTNHPALFVRNPDWSAVFDMDGPQAAATRRKLLDMVAADRMQVAFYHAPFPAVGFIAREGNGFEMVPVQWSSAV